MLFYGIPSALASEKRGSRRLERDPIFVGRKFDKEALAVDSIN
jgi:hypothetical protein